MSVIIRLQNLAWSANALDIRQFFRGLSIPEGGVHIVGGEQGDAFIAFSTDEDARQAMMHDGGKIKEMKIKLLLSSRTEMQKVIETARQQTLSLQTFMQTPQVQVTHSPVSTNQQQQKPSSPLEKRDNDSESSKERKDRHDRSRDRSRSRSRDRDRDRRDRGRDSRRRRDRSRSRDRDRRDRGSRRRRDRSRSRDRTRSRDRDNKRSQNDRRKESQDCQDDIPEVVCVGQFSKDKILGLQVGKKPIDNGIWEVPPQNQIQPMMLAPGILGAGVAATPNDSESRNLNFNSVGTTSLLQPNQFSLNGINGVLPPPGISPLNLNSMPPSLGIPSLSSLNRDRNSWPPEQPPRLSDIRFPRGTNFGNTDPSFPFGNNSNSNFRGNPRNNLLLSKMQELDGRRNPNAFQSNMNPGNFDAFGNSDRQKSVRNSGNGSRFSGENQNTSGHCIEVRNMPLSATYSDVRHAFQGIYIRKDGIKLINDTHGNRVGIAYVKFSKIEGKEVAMSIPRYVRGSEVEICSLEENIFDKAIDSFTPERDGDHETSSVSSAVPEIRSSCIMVVDLPSFAKEVDIAKAFSDWKINDLFITTTKESNGSIQYLAYLQFNRPEDAKISLQSSLKIGPKAITAISISDEKFTQAKRAFEVENLGEGGSPDCIVMRGLPFQTMDRDILDYFSDIGLVPRRIHMMLNKHGAPSGECFCEFDCTEEAIRATGKNGIPLGKLVPSIELVSRNKMHDTLEQADAHLMDSPKPFPLALQERPRFNSLPNHGPRFGNGNFPPPQPPRGPPGMMGMGPRHLGINRIQPPVDYVEGFGKPGCVLSLENVPFKADINEIIEFFGDFDIKRENVIRRYNEKGMPTGDARVAFSSPSEAQRALRELRHCKVRERTIYLKMA